MHAHALSLASSQLCSFLNGRKKQVILCEDVNPVWFAAAVSQREEEREREKRRNEKTVCMSDSHICLSNANSTFKMSLVILWHPGGTLWYFKHTERPRGSKVSAACLQFEDAASGLLQSSADAADDASRKGKDFLWSFKCKWELQLNS